MRKTQKQGKASGYSSASSTDAESNTCSYYFLPEWMTAPPPESLPPPTFREQT